MIIESRGSRSVETVISDPHHSYLTRSAHAVSVERDKVSVPGVETVYLEKSGQTKEYAWDWERGPFVKRDCIEHSVTPHVRIIYQFACGGCMTAVFPRSMGWFHEYFNVASRMTNGDSWGWYIPHIWWQPFDPTLPDG